MPLMETTGTTNRAPTLTGQSRRTIFGLQFRTTALLAGVVLAATGLTGSMHLRMSSREAVTQTKRYASNLARSLALAVADEVERRDRSALLAITQSLVPDTELAYLIFTDVKGELLASCQHGTGNITHLVLEDARQVSVEPINQPLLTYVGDKMPRIDVVYPVPAEHSLRDQGAPADSSAAQLHPTIGYVRLGVSLAGSQQRLTALVRNVLGLALGITLLMVPLGYEVVRNVVGPLNKIAEAARNYARGNLDVRVKLKRRDEIGALTEAFNSMADELAQTHTKLVRAKTQLEDRIIQRTMALEDANRKLKDMASRDPMTGLFNRRHFNHLLGQLFAEAVRYRTDLTCMMIDLDNLKRVNDTLGHGSGDQLLQLTASVIRDSVRESDLPVRYGGDEFTVLLPQTAPDDARASAERILKLFRERLAKQLPDAAIASLSIGLASRQGDQPPDPQTLVQLADEALYLAKAGGKNRITVLRPVPV